MSKHEVDEEQSIIDEILGAYSSAKDVKRMQLIEQLCVGIEREKQEHIEELQAMISKLQEGIQEIMAEKRMLLEKEEEMKRFKEMQLESESEYKNKIEQFLQQQTQLSTLVRNYSNMISTLSTMESTTTTSHKKTLQHKSIELSLMHHVAPMTIIVQDEDEEGNGKTKETSRKRNQVVKGFIARSEHAASIPFEFVWNSNQQQQQDWNDKMDTCNTLWKYIEQSIITSPQSTTTAP